MFLGFTPSNDEFGPSSECGFLEYEPTPYEVVYEENKLELRYYESDVDAGRDVPVVLAPAFVNTPAIMDLDTVRSVVRRFLERGFDVYVVDWGDPSSLDTSLSFDDYVGRYLEACVEVARDCAAVDGVHVFGFSTSASLETAFAAMHPDDVRTLSLQGPPLDFHVDGGMLDYRPVADAIDVRRSVDGFGNVPAALYDAGFALGRPTTLNTDLPIWAVGGLDGPESVARAGRIARWMADGFDIPGELFRQFVEDLFEDNLLVANELVIDARRVDLADVTVAVALVIGAEDSYVPRDASLPILRVVGSEDTNGFEMPTDHVGTFVHPEAHDTYWPRIWDWLAERT